MKKVFCKNFIIFFSLVFASCAGKNDQQTKIRIVDLQGKSRPIHTQVPELNLQAMYMQGLSPQTSDASRNSAQTKNSQETSQQTDSQNNSDFGSFSSKAIQQTFQPTAQKENQQVVANNNVVTTAGAVQNSNQTVQYDLSESDEVPVAEKIMEKKPTKKFAASNKSAKKIAASTNSAKGIFVQVGSFSVLRNAKQSLASMEKFYKGTVETIDGDKPIYRVLLGPFPNKKKANQMVLKITNSGREAIIVRNK